MPTEMKLWRIDSERPTPLTQQKLDLESRLEEWLRRDISLISQDLLVIGQQVETAYGGFIDLLAIDPVGNLVILELKRDKTPRDIVAQVLDYASWVKDLGNETINEISKRFLKGKDLEQAFKEHFNEELEVLNERHRMYIVASSLDPATERIVKYLSETHDVDINVATFGYFKTEQGEFLGRSLLLDDTEVQTRAAGKSKRNPPRSWEEFRSLAEKSGVIDLYDKVLKELRPLFDGVNRTRTNLAFFGHLSESRSRNVIIGIYPELSTPTDGLVIMLLMDRLYEYFRMSEDQIKPILCAPAKNVSTYDPNSTWFFNSDRLKELITLLSAAKKVVSDLMTLRST